VQRPLVHLSHGSHKASASNASSHFYRRTGTDGSSTRARVIKSLLDHQGIPSIAVQVVAPPHAPPRLIIRLMTRRRALWQRIRCEPTLRIIAAMRDPTLSDLPGRQAKKAVSQHTSPRESMTEVTK
jgi:hypothetical protein